MRREEEEEEEEEEEKTLGGEHTEWMADNFRDLRLSSSSDFAIKSLDEVKTTSNQLPSPAFIANTVLPEGLPSERRYRLICIPHETSCSMGVEA